MKITQEVKAFAIEQAKRRCECTGANCRHHLSGARCKRGLRGDDWKVYWRSEDGGMTRENIEAWCLECFDNNFDVPRETVALLFMDIFGYGELAEENHRQAVTLKSVLRDCAARAADVHKGRVVLDRLDDDILLEFPKGRHALSAAQHAVPTFKELTDRLNLPVPEVRGAIHFGEVTRWRNGILVGDAIDLTSRVARIAQGGQIVVTAAAVPLIRLGIDLEPVSVELAVDEEVWSLRI